MNKQNILELADLIGQQPDTEPHDADGFCMRGELHLCDTPSCIMGFAAFLHTKGNQTESNVYETACAHLGLPKFPDEGSRDITNRLFYPEMRTAHFMSHRGDKGYISAKRAARTLRHLAETGRVSWSA